MYFEIKLYFTSNLCGRKAEEGGGGFESELESIEIFQKRRQVSRLTNFRSKHCKFNPSILRVIVKNKNNKNKIPQNLIPVFVSIH